MTKPKKEKPRIGWIIRRHAIKELKEYEHNPRRISESDYNLLLRSIQEDGYRNRIQVNTDLTILAGHQRKRALLECGWNEEDIIEVLMPLEYLKPEQFQKINVRDNLSFGEFDFEIVANHFDPELLIDAGMPKDWVFPEFDDGTEETKPEKQEDERGLCKSCPFKENIL